MNEHDIRTIVQAEEPHERSPGPGVGAAPSRVTRTAGPDVAAGETLTLATRRLWHLRRSPGRLVGVVMNPLVLMIAVGYLFGEAVVSDRPGHYLDYLMPGVLLQVGLASIGPTAISMSLDLQRGVMDRFRSLPVARVSVLAGQVLSDWIVGLAAATVIAVIGLALGWRPHTDPASAAAGAAVVAVFILTMVCLGVLIGLSVRNVESIDSIGALVLVVLSFLSTAVISAAGMPAWIRPLVEWNPVSAAASLCRRHWGGPVTAATSFPTQHATAVVILSVGIVLVGSVVASLRLFRTATP
jgi:ABC-2 type transport system permease protein